MPPRSTPRPRPAYDFEAAAGPRRWRAGALIAGVAVLALLGYCAVHDDGLGLAPGAVDVVDAFVAGRPGAESVASAALARETPEALRAALAADPDREGRRAATLFERARLAAATGDFDRPPGRSALDFYGQVLALDPGNAAALAGRAALAQAALDRARATSSRGDDAAADAALAAAARLGIPAADIGALRATLTQTRAKRQRDTAATARLESMLLRADAARAAGRLVAPPGDNARDLYAGVLAHDPYNPAAEAGLNAIVDTLLADVDAALAAGDTARARSALAAAAAVRPDSAAVAAARRRLAGDG